MTCAAYFAAYPGYGRLRRLSGVQSADRDSAWMLLAECGEVDAVVSRRAGVGVNVLDLLVGAPARPSKSPHRSMGDRAYGGVSARRHDGGMEDGGDTEHPQPSRALLAGQAAALSLGCAVIGVVMALVAVVMMAGGLAGAWNWLWAGLGGR